MKMKTILISGVAVVIMLLGGYWCTTKQTYKDRHSYPPDFPQNYFECEARGGKYLDTDGTFSRCEYQGKWYEFDG